MIYTKRMRDTREDNDELQKDIAKILGEHLTTYRRWESGETEIPIHILLELCRIYKKTPNYMLGIEE